MAAANTKSTIVTNADSVPRKLCAVNLAHGRLREQVATVEIAAADDNASIYRLFRVRSDFRISSLELFNDAIASGTAFDLGVYQTADNGAAVVDADLFATDVSLASARVVPTDLLFEVLDINKIEKPLWEMLGLSSDPKIEYDIALTADTVGTAAGTITMRMRYVAND